MTFEVIALSDNPNGFGHTGVILYNERTGYVEAGKYSPKFKPGDEVTISFHDSTQFFGLNWASEGFEAAIPMRPRRHYVEPEHVPTHYLCIHMFRDYGDGREGLSMLRIEAERRDEIPNAVEQHAKIFGKVDRFEIVDIGIV